MGQLSDFQRDVSKDHHRRLSFGTVAEQYDRHRPGYPAEMVEALLQYARAQPGARILDVGAGTGRATLALAERGYELTAIEPDGEMAAVASKRAATAGQRLDILTTDFEHAQLPPHSFRVVISATAWHWVTPGLRNQLAARVLEPGGALAPFWNRPQWHDNELRPAFDCAYAAVEQQFAARPPGPMNPFGAPPQIRDAGEWLRHEFKDDPDFTELEARVYDWRQRYTSTEYLGLLGTHSDHIMLPAEPRAQLFGALEEAIEVAGGSFELGYQTLLCLARRRPI